MKLLVIFASLFALGSMTPEQDLVSIEEEPYGEDKGKLKEGKPEANNPVKGNEAKPKENIEEEPYGEGKQKIVKKEGKKEEKTLPPIIVDDPVYVVKPEMDLGKFSELKHGVSGKVSTSAVQYEQGKEEKKRTLEITEFNYSGEGT